MRFIGKIDIELYSRCACSRIITDEVVLTPNRAQHIIERRGQEFYDRYCDLFGVIVSDPDYVFQDSKKNTALVSKMFVENGEAVNIVLRLAVEGDDHGAGVAGGGNAGDHYGSLAHFDVVFVGQGVVFVQGQQGIIFDIEIDDDIGHEEGK